MPLWMRLNLRQKAVYEVIQAPPPSLLPLTLAGNELDFLVRGLALGPHRNTYLPRLVDRRLGPIVIDEGAVPGVSSRRIRVRFYGPDPLDPGGGDDAAPGEGTGDICEVHIGWRWFFSLWRGPLVDEVVGAAERPLWPEVAAPDWSWEGVDFRPPPYYVSEEGLPWRYGLDDGLLGIGLEKQVVRRNIGGKGARNREGISSCPMGTVRAKGPGRGGAPPAVAACVGAGNMACDEGDEGDEGDEVLEVQLGAGALPEVAEVSGRGAFEAAD